MWMTYFYSPTGRRLSKVKDSTEKKLVLKVLGRPAQYLNIESSWSRRGSIGLQQTNLLRKLLTRTKYRVVKSHKPYEFIKHKREGKQIP